MLRDKASSPVKKKVNKTSQVLEPFDCAREMQLSKRLCASPCRLVNDYLKWRKHNSPRLLETLARLALFSVNPCWAGPSRAVMRPERWKNYTRRRIMEKCKDRHARTHTQTLIAKWSSLFEEEEEEKHFLFVDDAGAAPVLERRKRERRFLFCFVFV